jgi:putative oxidoreductase
MTPMLADTRLSTTLTQYVADVFARLGQFPTSAIQLMARVAVGAVFFKSGLTKIANWDLTVMLFRDEYAVPILPPHIAAFLGTTAEMTCPILLVLGLATRLGTLPLLAMTFVIQTFVYPENWAEHLTWATLLLLVLSRGPGAISIDHLIAGALRRRGAL